MVNKRAIIIWLAIIILVMFTLPFAVARLASECSGMALCMMLFLIVNPVYSAILGYRCGKDIKKMWNLPLVSAVAFLAGTWIFFDIHELWFVVYATVYLAIGWIAMAISKYINGSNKSNDIFPFSDAPDTAVFICSHILDSGEDILFVSHDADDGAWQFLCDKEHNESDARIVSLKYVLDLDPTISNLNDLPLGYCAERKSKNDKWVIAKN
jgi:hypothetical protein